MSTSHRGLSLKNEGVPVRQFKERVEKHLHHPITSKQFAMLYNGWVTYKLRHQGLSSYQTAYYWLRKGYVPREHANSLSNYLITGWKVV